MEPLFLGYLLIPLGYTSVLAALSASAERALVRGQPEKAVKILTWARKAPFLATYRSMCDVNLITAAYSLEDFDLVDSVWQDLEPKLESLRPYAGSALASYGATLIGRGRYREAEELLRSPLQDPRPNQIPDSVTVLCRAFCRANLASALTNLGQLDEARALLNTVEQETESSPLLASLVLFLQAFLEFLDGKPDSARDYAGRIEFTHLPLLYRTELRYHYAILMARTNDPVSAEAAASGVAWDTSSYRKLTRLRTLARAEIHAAVNEPQVALSYYRDLRSLRHRGALCYLRAAALAHREGDPALHQDFLQAALELDPESHWAKVANKKLHS